MVLRMMLTRRTPRRLRVSGTRPSIRGSIMATRRRARLRARVSYWIIWKWKYSSLQCPGWHAWVTLNRIIFRGKIHDKCHTLVTVTRHGTHTAHFYLYHHIKLKSLNPTLVIVSSLKHNFAINFLLLLASYFPVTRHSSVSRPLKPGRHETPAAIYLGPGTGPVWPGPALLGSCAPVISVSYSAISTHNCGQGQMEHGVLSHCNWNPKTCGVIVIKSSCSIINI